jgi:NADPH:quinone reductase-like Zn-dependent oxidoreductase
MRALVLARQDTPPVLTDVPVPQPTRGEVLVRVTASSVNPHDAMVASGAAARYMEYRFPVVLGSDLAGTVEATGAGVDDLSPGDRVFGLVRERVAGRGSLAESVAVPREWITPTPDGLDDVSAGALGLAALTALRCVEAVEPVKRDDVVLVNGATGGVGSYAVQMLAARGATVVATARPGEEEHVRQLGASDVVDWSGGNVAAAVRALHPDGVDVLIDLVSRDREAFSALATTVVRPAGRVACTGHAADPERLSGLRAVNVLAEVDRDALRTIAELAAGGDLRPVITHDFALEDVDQAFRTLRAGVVGKVAVHL